MIFTPRLLTSIWNTLNQSLRFGGNPDAPSVEKFVAYYTSPDADPGFSWSDRAKSLTYLYDLTINQLQATPAGGPQASEVDRANDSLWRLLPPTLLEKDPYWRFVWTEALGVPPTNKPNPDILRLVVEQGVDVKPFMRPAEWMKMWTPKRGPYEAKEWMQLRVPDDWTKLWLKAANAPRRSPWTDWTDSFRVPDLDLMRLVLEQGFDVHALMQPADWAGMWEKVAAIPQPETMRFVVEEGFGVRQPGDWVKVWEQAVRALDVTTLRCVLKQGFDARTVMQPADWAGLWARATDPANAAAMRFILEQGMGLDALMPPADLKKVWFSADETVTRLLLKYGYDVNTRDDRGYTALFHASDPYAPRREVIYELVEAGITLEDAPAIINYDPADISDKFAAMDCRAIASLLQEKVAEAAAKRLTGAADAPPAA